MNDRPGGDSGHDPQEVVELERNFASMRELQAEVAPFLSSDGMFLPAAEPLAVDTVVRFRITLPEGFVLIEGTGVVIWTRRAAAAEPPGMAIRYVSLGPEAQETIDAIIDSHLASGGDLFALEPDEDETEGFPTDALESGRTAPSETFPARPGSTHKELAQARVTIRGEPGDDREATTNQAGDGSRDAGVSGVGEMAADDTGWEEDRMRPAPRFLVDVEYRRPERALHHEFDQEADAAGSGDASGAERATDGTEGGDPWLAEGPIEDEDDDTVVVLEADPLAVAEEVAAEQAPDREPAAEAPAVEPAEPVIPSFLESWKEEIADGDRSSQEAVGAVVDGPGGVRWEPEESIPEVERSTEEVTPGATFGGVEDGMPAGMLADAAVPQTASPTRRGSWLWLLPILAVVAVAVTVYVEWDRVRALVSPTPVDRGAPVLTTDETGVEPATAAPSAAVVPVEAGPAEQPDRSEPPVLSAAESAPAEGVPQPVTAEENAAPAPAPLAPATAVEEISVQPMQAGTAVVVKANGAVAADSVAVFPMDDPPRILVRIRGIDEGYPQYEVAGGTREVEKVRVGHHPELRPPALYVVLDLTDPTVGVTDLAVEGDTVRVTVAAR